MGQAVVDLPDPLEKQPTGANSADDLLAQLAGDEIDRMLTEANVDATATTEETPAAPGSAAVAPVIDTTAQQTSDGSTAAAVDDLLSSLEEPAPAAAAADPASNESPSSTLDPNEIDKLLNEAAETPAAEGTSADGGTKLDIDQALAAEADAKLAPHTAALAADAADEVAHAQASTIAAPSTLAPADAGATESAERDGLLATVAGESQEDDELAPLPLWLRPLEWLSAPMDAFSDEARSFLGKAAILTLANSAAVIIYVLMFRRH